MKRKGFTLIELAMVIAIIGVVVAIVLPRLDPFLPQRRLKSAARLLAGTISLAYGESVAKNKIYRLYIEPSEGKYWLTEVKELDEEQGGSTAIGIRLGTHFELLQHEESGAKHIEETAPSEPMFAPKELPPGVRFSSVEVRNNIIGTTSGPKYIEFHPLGSASPATIRLVNDKGEQLAVWYDGATGMPTLLPWNSESG